MTIAMQPIYTQTVGAGGAAIIDFNNIPQFYTDLMLVVSARNSVSNEADIVFNLDYGATRTTRGIFGSGSVASSSAPSDIRVYATAPSQTASTFASSTLYIPNYASNTLKSMTSDSVQENNATASFLSLRAHLWNSTAAITNIRLGATGASGTFTQHSTFTLYGITKG